MNEVKMIQLRDNPAWKDAFAAWFHEKWGVPVAAYLESMEACVKNQATVPQWYGVVEKGSIIAGLGVITNDFHHRKDLTPNVCALYVEESHRGHGIAGKMLRFVCEDMEKQGTDTLYLLTDHTSYYERYGWTFLCMAQGDGEPHLARVYVHRTT